MCSHLFLGNRLGDTGLQNLCNVLSGLPNLVHLGLASNNITENGLNALVTVVSSDINPLMVSITEYRNEVNRISVLCLLALATLFCV